MFVHVTQSKSRTAFRWQASLLGLGLLTISLLFWRPALAADLPSEGSPSSGGESWSSAPAPAAGVGVAPNTSPANAVMATGTVNAQPAASQVRSTSSQPAAKPTQDEVADADPEALSMFRPHLDPYGAWVDDPRYGRVWVPNRAVVGQNFSPYVTQGHWALDGDDNWIWVSDHPFGWVVFHYGRWFYAPEFGWAWVPGRTYAPNWVIWRLPTAEYSYVGWAPMPPRYGWFSSGAVWYSSYGSVSYVFCPSDYLFAPSLGVYVVHDPWLVSRLGIYTSFYYSPYYYGHYHHYHHHGVAHGGGGYHPPAYGPPVHRTRISPRAIPRERVAADPRAVAFAPRSSGASRSEYRDAPRGRIRSASSLGASRGEFARPTRSDSRSFDRAPSLPRDRNVTSFSSREGGRTRESFARPSSRVQSTPFTRNSPSRSAPSVRMPSMHSPSPRSQPSFRTPSVAPHRSPSFRSPSFSTPHRSPSSGGFRHRR